jgi:hypothetical protein
LTNLRHGVSPTTPSAADLPDPFERAGRPTTRAINTDSPKERRTMPIQPTAAQRMIGDVAPKLVQLTDDCVEPSLV